MRMYAYVCVCMRMLGLTSSKKCMETWLTETSSMWKRLEQRRRDEHNVEKSSSVGRSNQTTKERK